MPGDVTRLLEAVRAGDRESLDEVFALIYDELKEIAGRQRRRWRGNHTLDTTSLVHEAYVRLVGQAELAAENRAHFSALAARAMRHILVDYARQRDARKRGGGLERMPLEALDGPEAGLKISEDGSGLLLELDAALDRLEQVDERSARVVEQRFFGGLTIEETAAALGISARTVKRDWAVAQAWLRREMQPPS